MPLTSQDRIGSIGPRASAGSFSENLVSEGGSL
jgi:hypothetical protein